MNWASLIYSRCMKSIVKVSCVEQLFVSFNIFFAFSNKGINKSTAPFAYRCEKFIILRWTINIFERQSVDKHINIVEEKSQYIKPCQSHICGFLWFLSWKTANRKIPLHFPFVFEYLFTNFKSGIANCSSDCSIFGSTTRMPNKMQLNLNWSSRFAACGFNKLKYVFNAPIPSTHTTIKRCLPISLLLFQDAMF